MHILHRFPRGLDDISNNNNDNVLYKILIQSHCGV